jgi:hypothetical protein
LGSPNSLSHHLLVGIVGEIVVEVVDTRVVTGFVVTGVVVEDVIEVPGIVVFTIDFVVVGVMAVELGSDLHDIATKDEAIRKISIVIIILLIMFSLSKTIG